MPACLLLTLHATRRRGRRPRLQPLQPRGVHGERHHSHPHISSPRRRERKDPAPPGRWRPVEARASEQRAAQGAVAADVASALPHAHHRAAAHRERSHARRVPLQLQRSLASPCSGALAARWSARGRAVRCGGVDGRRDAAVVRLPRARQPSAGAGSQPRHVWVAPDQWRWHSLHLLCVDVCMHTATICVLTRC